ncbi:papain-like cysteine protease family protein [Bradyrhizobium sp. SZCCHNS1054]|uniref:papain-like cysteine protease family protein n=1 Tax=Bradyrhizobium sp. SZCCHNS1054 TaxID=3057301 RepID=UPI00396732E9
MACWRRTVRFGLAPPSLLRRKSIANVRIVRGIVGDGGFDTSTLYIVDPDGGRNYRETMTNFAQELEQIAIDDLGPDGPGNLYPQIIRFT